MKWEENKISFIFKDLAFLNEKIIFSQFSLSSILYSLLQQTKLSYSTGVSSL